MGAERAPAATAAPLRRLRRRGVWLSDKVDLQSLLNFQARKITAWFFIMFFDPTLVLSENPNLTRQFFQVELKKIQFTKSKPCASTPIKAAVKADKRA
jgi:hypothetical protein